MELPPGQVKKKKKPVNFSNVDLGILLFLFFFKVIFIQNVFSVCLSESSFDGFSTRLLMFPFPAPPNRTERVTSHMPVSC